MPSSPLQTIFGNRQNVKLSGATTPISKVAKCILDKHNIVSQKRTYQVGKEKHTCWYKGSRPCPLGLLPSISKSCLQTAWVAKNAKLSCVIRNDFKDFVSQHLLLGVQ